MDALLIAGLGAGAAAAAFLAALAARRRSRPQPSRENPGCVPAAAERSEASPSYAAVHEALSRLISRTDRDAFVVFNAGRKRIVQFAGGTDGLLLDLPVESLSEAERARAESYFGAIDVRLLERPNFSSFQIEFGGSVDDAARTTIEVFDRVYALAPGSPLSIEEN